MPSIFLSHCSKDNIFARKLASDLSRAGVFVWIDEAEIKLDDSLVNKISPVQKDIDYFITVLSKNSVQSEWITRELKIILTESTTHDKFKVLPAVIDDCEIPGFLKGKLHASFVKEYNYIAGLQFILNHLFPEKYIDAKNIVLNSDLYIKLEEDNELILTLWNDTNFLKNATLVDYIIYPRLLSIMEISNKLNNDIIYNKMYDFFVSEARNKNDKLRSECASEIWWVLLEDFETEEKILDNFFHFSDRIKEYIIDSIGVDCDPKYLFLINKILDLGDQNTKKLLDIKEHMLRNRKSAC